MNLCSPFTISITSEFALTVNSSIMFIPTQRAYLPERVMFYLYPLEDFHTPIIQFIYYYLLFFHFIYLVKL